MSDLTRPIIGIENRSAPEVFYIMCDRFRASQAEIERLRNIVSQCADALGNGAYIAPSASLEFMEKLPGEIQSVVAALSGSKE